MDKKFNFLDENRSLCKNDITEIAEWLKNNDINKLLFSHKNTLLWCAVYDGVLEIVDYLVKRDADINICGEYNTLIELAATYGHLDIIKYFFKNGFKKEIFLSDNSLIYAASSNFPEIIRYLVNEGKDIEQHLYNKIEEDTALQMASQNNSIDCVKLLCELGANVNVQTTDTPLYIAAGQGNFEIVKILISYGADINKGNDIGTTPYTIAKTYKHSKIAEYLLKHGAKTD